MNPLEKKFEQFLWNSRFLTPLDGIYLALSVLALEDMQRFHRSTLDLVQEITDDTV